MPDKLNKLKSILELMQNDTVTPKVLGDFLQMVLKTIKENKDEFQTISNSTFSNLQKSLDYIEREHMGVLDSVDKKNDVISKEMKYQMAQIQKMCQEVMDCKPENGKDGKDADEEMIIDSVLSKMPDPIVLDNAGQIRDKLETLKDEDRLDASAIKNLPEFIKEDKRIGFGSMLKEAPKDGLIYGRQNRAWVEVATGGGTWGSITGTLSDQTDLQSALNAKQDVVSVINGLTKTGSEIKLGGILTEDTTITGGLFSWILSALNISLLATNSAQLLGQNTSIGGSTTLKIKTPDIYNASSASGRYLKLVDDTTGEVEYDTPTGGAWGSITGTLSSQTDLQNALDDKEDVANKSTSVATDQASDTKYPSVKSVYDWATGLFQTLANLSTDLTASATKYPSVNAVNTGLSAKEDVSNKSTTTTLGTSDTLYPTQNAVKTYVDNAWIVQPINAQTGTTYTFVLSDAGKLVTGSNASAITFTVPPNSSVAFAVGTHIDITQTGAGVLSIAPGSGVTINSQDSNRKIFAQYVSATLIKTATDTWLLVGNLRA